MTADPPEASEQPLDFEAVAKVAQRIRLSDVRLRWSQLGIFGESEPADPEWGAKAFLSFESHAAVDEETTPEPGEGLLVQCVFRLQYFADLDSTVAESAPEVDESNPPDVAIEAVFDLNYEVRDWSEISSSDAQQFAITNGTHNAWPYWREYAQTTVARLGLDPYVVGPFKLPSKHDPS